MGKTAEHRLGTPEQIGQGIKELKKLHKYYLDEIKQNQNMVKHARDVSPEEIHYFKGREEAYTDHMAEIAYIIEMLEGTR